MYQAVMIPNKLSEQRVNMKTMLGKKNKGKDQKQKSLLEFSCQKAEDNSNYKWEGETQKIQKNQHFLHKFNTIHDFF